MEDFVMVPRQINRDLVDGRLNIKAYAVLNWIFLNTNPYNGRCDVSYSELVEVFREGISYDTMRKIVSILRAHKWIWFVDHRGKGGKFTIFPLNYQLTNRHIQSKSDFEITTKNVMSPQHNPESSSQPKHKLANRNHNSNQGKNQVNTSEKTTVSKPKITTPYTQNNTETDKSTFINVDNFQPNSSEDHRCKKIAKDLGIKHINYLLKVKNKHGLTLIENALGIYKELLHEGKKMDDPAAYFGGILNNLIRGKS